MHSGQFLESESHSGKTRKDGAQMNFKQAIHQESLQMKKSFYYLLAKKELQLKIFCDVYINYVLLIGSSNQFQI